MGEVLSEVGDLVFSLVIGYLGALEFLYVARHLYHWTFRHPDGNDNDADSLKRLQENMRNQLAAADARETNVGTNAMQDGVPYKDGFRIDPQQQEIEKLKAEQKLQEEKEKRRKEIEVELARQKKIEDETRQQLERAEAELERQRKQAATDEEKRNTIALLEAEREREKQQRMLEEQREAEENAQRLLAAEKYKELIQRQCEEQERADEENATHILEIERLQEVKQRRLEVEQELAEAAAKQEQLLAAEKMRILEIERLKEVEQGRLEEEHELAEAVQQEDKLLTEERERDMLQQAQELEQHELAEAVQQKDKLLTEEREREMLQQAQELEEEEADEQARLLLDAEREQERKQRTKEENARKFMDAEQRMVEELERQKGEAVHQHQLSATQPVFEEPCIKRIVAPLTESERSQPRTVKTQFGQTSNEAYSVNSKPLLFSEVSDDATTVEPTSSQYSDGTQPSEDMSTGTDQTMLMVSVLGNELELEREAPDGEDNSSTVQYTDEYLRSLDGIKQRPLVREDGSGRRRAFKKRRSSGSSNSSRESRTSREEELKMFTSLEEEENDGVNKEVDDFTAIKYSSEPTLKVRTPQRRHKRSPAKDAKTSPSISNESLKGSLEMLGEEATDPWGEVVPEHYKDTAFWKREKAMSIDEEEIELERPVGKENTHESDNDTAATNMPKTSSFEEATYSQHEEILSELQQQPYKDTEEEKKVIQDETRNDKNTNLQTSQNTEARSSPARSSSSPRLRRSPRIDEIDQYEERWKETAAVDTDNNKMGSNTPSITVQSAVDNASWRDEHGLMMQGLSDFYDFTASINPSRSRSTSRAATPTSPQESFQYPKNVSYNASQVEETELTEQEIIICSDEENLDIDIYDDTNEFRERDINKQVITEFIDKLQTESSSLEYSQDLSNHLCNEFISDRLKTVADDPNKRTTSNEDVPSILFESVDITSSTLLVETLHASHSVSQYLSNSSLETSDNMLGEIDTKEEHLFNRNEDNHNSDTECSKTNMSLLVENLRAERCRSKSRSRSPLPTSDNLQRSLDSRREKLIQHNDDVFENLQQRQSIDRQAKSEVELRFVETPSISVEYIGEKTNTSCTEQNYVSVDSMSRLVESLRTARASSRSRSKSPMRIPTAENLARSVEGRRTKLIQQNDVFFEQLIEKSKSPEPQVSVEYVYEIVESIDEASTLSIDNVTMTRSRSTSRDFSPSLPTSSTQDTTPKNVQYQFMARPITRSNFEDNDLCANVSLENLSDYYDFHRMLNLEASRNKTLYKNSEEIESSLASKQRLVDEEALTTLRTANEEIELRTVTPNIMEDSTHESDELKEVAGVAITFNRDKLRQLKCTPSTPDYDRSISSELKDVQRIKDEIIASGYKRSTYVGESMDLGSEYEDLRRTTARFQRSQSRSRSPFYNESDLIEEARRNAAETRQMQEEILAEITTAFVDKPENEEKLGAKPKVEQKKTVGNLEHSFSKELADTQRIKEELLSSGFQRSTYVGESLDLSAQFENLRRDAADFRRSRSKSRSPLDSQELAEITKIDAESVKRELQDRILDEIEKNTINFQDFSRHLNADFLDNDRRASDSALIQKPEIIFQIQDNDGDLDMEPEEYHHYRRFSLYQEQPVEEYPNDDYVYVSQIEVRTPNGTRTWTREDFYSSEFDNFELTDSLTTSDEISVKVMDDNAEHGHEEEDTDGSEDERRTVVDVEDEIDEDICDFNERGPADESHHEQSECEEADRAVDHYADKRADDWKDVGIVDVLLNYEDSNSSASEAQAEEGAVGGMDNEERRAYDSDSFAIDQIYDEAVRNRKQSGILRDYDCILKEMQNHFIENIASANGRPLIEGTLANDNERYAIWSKTRDFERSNLLRSNAAETSLNFIENERSDSERRYLGDATITARNSTRLRSRYGYVPVLQNNAGTDTDVDLNYLPKREYNWRKNFKLDEEEQQEIDRPENENEYQNKDEEYEEMEETHLDMRKFSLGGESITLFSRSPEREILAGVLEEDALTTYAENEQQMADDLKANDIANDTKECDEKPKKKKSKKKTRKESKSSMDKYSKDEDDSENQMYSRRSSSIQMETDSPKRKSRSRRNSRNSLVNEDSAELFSPRSSIGCVEPISDLTEMATPLKKKTKKRKKAKETFVHEPEIQEEHVVSVENAISATITPNSASVNLLSALSPQNSVCVTPVSTESEISERPKNVKAATNTTTIESFDILKDGNLYPLF